MVRPRLVDKKRKVNMTDRELLEAAAKAAGIERWYWSSGLMIVGPATREEPWNPLDDDGDALRLAVRLAIMIDPSGSMAKAITCNRPPETDPVEKYAGDPNASCRRAIVRAAAVMASASPVQQPVFGAA